MGHPVSQLNHIFFSFQELSPTILSDEDSAKDEIDSILNEVEQMAISKLDLPFTSAYVTKRVSRVKKAKNYLEDIQEVLSQESYTS